MNANDLKELLESSKNRFAVFEDRNTLSQCDFSVSELVNLISDFLTDQQKRQLFELEHFKKLDSNTKSSIIICIADDNIKLEILENSNIISNFSNNQVLSVVKSLGDYGKIQILHNLEFLKKYDVKDFKIQEMIRS